MTRDRDTIFSLSSGRPPVAVAVIRVSGPNARTALETLAGRVPQPRHAGFARLRDRPGGAVLDEAENRLHAQKGILAWCLEVDGR